MTQFSKAHWTTDENSVHMSVEFSKVNKAKRLVSGFATLDNIDTEGDIVLAEASARAFARARGNLREMHKKDSAVGRIVSFKEDVFRAPDGKKYRGIFVTARVSEGAQDTWLKVLDGTLSGFSIGGAIIESEEDFNKDAGTKVRIIKDYDLTELSLVDNPGNQYANVFQIQKSVDGSVTVKGMAADTDILNVFYCETDKISQEKPEDEYSCPICTERMTNIGWIEDGPTKDEKVNTLVTKFLDAANSEGGVEVTKSNDTTFEKVIDSTPINEEEDESVATGHEEGDPTEVPTPADPADAPVEEVDEPAEVEEVEDEEEVISKKIDSLKDDISEILKRDKKDTSEKIDALEKAVRQINDDFNKKASEFEKKFEELDTNLETAKSRLTAFEKSLNKINSGSALRKSADFEESVEQVQNDDSAWDGAFSVKNLLR